MRGNCGQKCEVIEKDGNIVEATFIMEKSQPTQIEETERQSGWLMSI